MFLAMEALLAQVRIHKGFVSNEIRVEPQNISCFVCLCQMLKIHLECQSQHHHLEWFLKEYVTAPSPVSNKDVEFCSFSHCNVGSSFGVFGSLN